MPYDLKLASNKPLTVQSWRKTNALFTDLPFTTGLVRVEENMGSALLSFLCSESNKSDHDIRYALTTMATGLDEHYPFNNRPAADLIVKNADLILASGTDPLGSGYSNIVWSLMSNVIILDRLCAMFGVMATSPSQPVPRVHCEQSTIGTAAQFLHDLTPPIKLLSKFCLAWATRREADEQATSNVSNPVACSDPSNIALTLSTRIVSRGKQRALINMASGLDMLALALTISRLNGGIFPDKQSEFQEILVKLGSINLPNRQIDFLRTEAAALHTVLSPHSWKRYSVNRVYLCRVFCSLGNRRPHSLVMMEDHILSAALKLSYGENFGTTLTCLHDGIKATENSLTRDLEACNWFDLSIPTNALNNQPSQSLPAAEIDYSSLLQTALEKLVANDSIGGLASPPYSPSHFPSSSTIAGSPCINPQLLDLHQITLDDQDMPMAEEDGGDGDSRGGVKQAEEAVKENNEGQGQQELEDEGQEDDQKETQVNQSAITVDRYLDSDSDLTDLLSDEEDDQGGEEQEEDKKEEDIVQEEAEDEQDEDVGSEKHADEQEMVVEDERIEEDTVMEDGVEEDGGEEDGAERLEEEEDDEEQVDVLSPLDIRRSAHLQGEADGAERLEEDKDKEEDKEQVNVHIRRSARLRTQTAYPPPSPSHDCLATTREQPGGHAGNSIPSRTRVTLVENMQSRSKSMPSRKRATLFEVEDSLIDEDQPKLKDVGDSIRNTSISIHIAGWGSTREAGPIPFIHVPVQIVPPGDVDSMGIDAETLRRLETRVQEGFIDGVPPHLLPTAQSLMYEPDSHQSRFFTAPHSEYVKLSSDTIQGVFRQRHILIHGNTFNYEYGWNLESFGRLYDVEMRTSIQASHLINPSNPAVRHLQGTLREMFQITTTFPPDTCPSLNAISLPSPYRNLLVPSKWESIASHEIAQSRVLAPSYKTLFDVPDTRGQTEWSLIGGKDAISSMHIDSEGFGTLILVLEGSKYWIIATRIGDNEDISSVDCLGPNWDPYVFNQGEKLSRYRFEAVHLQKGDMLIMRPGTLHWVLGTANTICVGRHFYASSTMTASIISLVHTSLLNGALTNESKAETRTLLYQMMHFWSSRINKRDVDGAHIPDLSSPVEFFDIVYLGIFIIVSRAFDSNFHDVIRPPLPLDDEIASAEAQFIALIHYFGEHYISIVDGVMIDPWYIVKRMLAEFSAAVVCFAQALNDSQEDDMDVDGEEREGGEEVVLPPKVKVIIDDVIAQSYPELINYYQHCLASRHKVFLWTGPPITILPRSEACESIVGVLISEGEQLDLPTCPIFIPPPASAPPPPPPCLSAAPKKRRGSTKDDDLQAKKQKS